MYGLVRPTSNLRLLNGVAVELIRCDLAGRSPPELPARLDWVIHAAAVVSDVAGDTECRAHIFDATANLISWLEATGLRIERFVYISTALVLGFGRLDIAPNRPGRSADFVPYVRWKRATEGLVLKSAAEGGLPAVVLRPADVFGPRDRTSCEHFCRMASRGVPLIVGNGEHLFPFCYTENLSQAVYRACLAGSAIGRCYTVMNEKPMSWKRFFGFLQERLGRPQRLGVPAAFAFAVAALQEGWRRVDPSFSPNLSFYRVLRATTDTSYDISHTVADLDYKPDTDEVAQLSSIANWYLQCCQCRA